MTVEQLIDRLLSENPQRKVVVNGYEDGFDEVDKISHVNIKKNVHKGDSEKDNAWWNGDYELSDNSDDEVAILLTRKS